MIIDCHAHLNLKQFDNNRDSVINRARDADVTWIIENGLERKSNLQALALSNLCPMVKPAFGLYPQNVGRLDLDSEFEILEKYNESYIALGEIGLDGMEGDLGLQKEILRRLIALGKKHSKPLIVHSRKAEKEVLAVLREERAENVILHAFHGSLGLAKEAVKLGYFISIPCNVVRSSQMQSFVSELPISHLVTETDAPYLGPNSREEINEPKNIRLSIKKIAEIKGLTQKDTENILFDNARRIFSL